MPDNAHNVCLNMKELSKRSEVIAKMLKPLVSDRDALYIHHTQKNSSEFVWVAVPSGENTQGAYDEKRFEIAERFYASYYERWCKNYNGNIEYWYLDRVYFHVYELDEIDIEYKEYLLLHCDPNENGEHAIYKKSPHLHIEKAPAPFPKAHLALNIGYLEPMLQDASALTNVFGGAIIMLKDQILQHL